MPDTVAPVKSNSEKTPYHCEITCKTENNWWDKAKPFVEVVGIILLAVYTGYTIKQVHVSQRGSRPFVGIAGMSVSHQWQDPKDKLWHKEAVAKANTTIMSAFVHIKNFGPLPALNFRSSNLVYIDNVLQPSQGSANLSDTLNPLDSISMGGIIGSDNYRGIVDGNKVLTMRTEFSYDGPDGHYMECSINRFQREFSAFVYVGACAK